MKNPKNKIIKRSGTVLHVSCPLPLADVRWTLIGATDEYAELKRRIAQICQDVTEACVIDELCIHDIVQGFREFGYEVIKQDGNGS